MAINFKAIAERLLADSPRYLSEWLPGGKQHGREYVCGNLRGDAGKSLSINIDTGVWRDFSENIGGADLISLYAAIHNIKQSEAANKFASGKDVAPDDAYLAGPESPPIPAHSKWGKPSHVFEYRQADGKIVGYICRFDPQNEDKQFMPRTCWRRDDGSIYWRWKKWPQLSPLYRLPELIARPDAPVLIVEGEKKANRAQRLLPEYVVIGWCGGAKAVKGTNWMPLDGRNVWMWPDANRAGLDAADDIKKLVPQLKIVDIARITPELPENWDLGDAPDDYDPRPYLTDNAILVVASALPARSLVERLDALNHEYAVILHGSKVLVMRYWRGEDGESKLLFLSSRDFIVWQQNNIVYMEDAEGKTKAVSVAKRWLEWDDRQQYEETYFEPGGKKYRNRYNLWDGFAVEPSPAGSCDLFLAHIRDNICNKNPEHYTWVMSWLADMFQKPARKLGTALVLRGAMGIGKGAFTSHVGHLLGKHYMTVTQSGQLVGKFNSHMADKLLMFVDEGWWSDDRAYGQGILRALITEQQITIEMKGKDAVTLSNYTRFIIAANADWVVPVSSGDERRFSIVDVGAEEQGNKAYFRAIDNQMRNGGYEKLLDYLLGYEYDENIPAKIIKTTALMENKIHSLPYEIKWFYNCLISEEIGDFSLSDNKENVIPCAKFYGAYQLWCQKIQARQLADNSLPKSIKKTKLYFIRKRFYDAATNPIWSYVFPRLSEMRQAFQDYIGGELDWENI